MKLADYRKKHLLSRAAFGALIGVNGVTVYRWETGRSFPLASSLRKIRETTAGKVAPKDFTLWVK